MQSIAMLLKSIAMKQEYCNGFVNVAISAFHKHERWEVKLYVSTSLEGRHNNNPHVLSALHESLQLKLVLN